MGYDVACTIEVTDGNCLLVQLVVRGGGVPESIISDQDGSFGTPVESTFNMGACAIYTYIIWNPTAATHIITATWSLEGKETIICAMSLVDTDTSGIGATGENQGDGSATVTCTITTETDDSWMISFVATEDNPTTAPDTGQSEEWELVVGGTPSGRKTGAGYTEELASAGVSNEQWTLSKSADWVVHIIEIKTAEAPGIDAEESMSITDNLSYISTFLREQLQSIDITSYFLSEANRLREYIESFNILDITVDMNLVPGGADYTRDIYENLAITSQLNTMLLSLRTSLEALNILDQTIEYQLSSFRDYIENIDITDISILSNTLIKTFQESLNILTTFQTSLIGIKELSEDLSLTTTILNKLTIIRSYLESLNITDLTVDTGMAQSYSREQEESLSLVTLFSTSLVEIRNYVESLDIADIVISSSWFRAELLEELDIVDTTIPILRLLRNFTEAFNIVDDLNTQLGAPPAAIHAFVRILRRVIEDGVVYG